MRGISIDPSEHPLLQKNCSGELMSDSDTKYSQTPQCAWLNVWCVAVRRQEQSAISPVHFHCLPRLTFGSKVFLVLFFLETCHLLPSTSRGSWTYLFFCMLWPADSTLFAPSPAFLPPSWSSYRIFDLQSVPLQLSCFSPCDSLESLRLSSFPNQTPSVLVLHWAAWPRIGFF